MKQGKALWDKLARENARHFVYSDYGKPGMTEEKFRDSGLDDYLTYIENDPLMIDRDMLFLEIGCGIGRMTEYIDKEFEVTGIDISGEMIKRAKNRVPFVKFIETDGKTIPLPDNYFDTAFSYLVFQHMKTKKEVESNFKEVYRVLKPRGLFKVRLRTNKEPDMTAWWAGIHYSRLEAVIMSKNIGFKVLKTEQVKDYGLWLWLEK